MLVPRAGIELVSLAVEAQNVNHWTAWEVPRMTKIKRLHVGEDVELEHCYTDGKRYSGMIILENILIVSYEGKNTCTL